MVDCPLLCYFTRVYIRFKEKKLHKHSQDPPLWQPSWRVLLYLSPSWRSADLGKQFPWFTCCSWVRKHLLLPSNLPLNSINQIFSRLLYAIFMDWSLETIPTPPCTEIDELKVVRGLFRRWCFVQMSTDPTSCQLIPASYTNDGTIFYCQLLPYSWIRSFWKIAPTLLWHKWFNFLFIQKGQHLYRVLNGKKRNGLHLTQTP